MIIVADVVKPLTIGIEIKFTTKPKRRSPMDSKITPVNNVKATTNCGSSGLPYADTISDIIAVGPSVMSLLVPRKQYTKQPRNAEYSPY